MLKLWAHRLVNSFSCRMGLFNLPLASGPVATCWVAARPGLGLLLPFLQVSTSAWLVAKILEHCLSEVPGPLYLKLQCSTENPHLYLPPQLRHF